MEKKVMRPGYKLSIDQKGKIITLSKQGVLYKYIAQRFDVSLMTISNVIRAFKEEGIK